MKTIVIDARQLRTSSGRYVERLLMYLQQIDKKHRYYVLLKPQDLETWKPKNKRFTPIACPFKEFTFAEQVDLLKQIRGLKPDLVHFAFTQQPVFYRGKMVTTMHDLTALRFRNPAKNWLIFTIKRWIYRWVNYRVAHKSTVVITPTEFVKDDVARFASINSRKVVVTYEAADPIPDAPEVVDGLEGKPFIMYVGRSQPHKNLARLIEAFAILKQQYPDLQLVLAGKKDVLYRRMQRSFKKHIPDIVFTGFVSEGQLRWLYQHTSVYVFPSLSEGFGLPGLEAMLHGAPVASSNATCLPEVYGDAVEYFDPLDVQNMATAIGKILKNDKRRKQLIAAGKKQARKYSWQRMAEQTLAIYNDVLGS